MEFGADTSPKLVPTAQVWIGQRNLGSPPQVYVARKLGISKKEKKNEEIKTYWEGELASTQMTTLLLAPEGSLYSAFIIPGSRRAS